MTRRMTTGMAALLVSGLLGAPLAASAGAEACLDAAGLPRVARVVGPEGTPAYVRVVEAERGVPTSVSRIAPVDAPLREVFERAAQPIAMEAEVWRILPREARSRVCAPVAMPQRRLDDETGIIVAVGLNYAAHAEEAGGGDVFLFPKPVEPSAPYGVVAPPDGVVLLDYEVELAYVLLEDVDLTARPDRETFLANTAWFVANDVTDREALIRRVGFSPPGTGFVEGKGRRNFLPAGPWMVRGTELFAALEACGETGLGIGLSVDEGGGYEERQRATTDLMIVKPFDLLEAIAEQIEREGIRTPMPWELEGEDRHFPFAVKTRPNDPPTLPAGSILVTGTPEGTAMKAPEILPVTLRGLLRFRSPLEQFRLEQIARVKSGEPGGYLAQGDRVRAWIDGLGAQEFTITAPGTPIQRDPCAPAQP